MVPWQNNWDNDVIFLLLLLFSYILFLTYYIFLHMIKQKIIFKLISRFVLKIIKAEKFLLVLFLFAPIYHISSNKRWASNKHRPLISIAPLSIYIAISASPLYIYIYDIYIYNIYIYISTVSLKQMLYCYIAISIFYSNPFVVIHWISSENFSFSHTTVTVISLYFYNDWFATKE